VIGAEPARSHRADRAGFAHLIPARSRVYRGGVRRTSFWARSGQPCMPRGSFRA